MPRDLATSLVYARSRPLIGRLAYYALKLLGVEIPLSVRIGRDLELAHGGFGVVIHPRTTIGDRVKIYPGVGLGRADIHLPAAQSAFEGIQVEDDVILATGAKVLCKVGVLRIASRQRGGRQRRPAPIHRRVRDLGRLAGALHRQARAFLNPNIMTIPSSPRICIVPPLSGVGGMVSFQGRLAQGLARRGISVTYDLDDAPFQAVLVVGGTRQLAGLWRLRRKGVRIVQRLDGMNWLHRLGRTSSRHYLRAESGNLLLAFIRSRLAHAIVYQSQFSRKWWERRHGSLPAPCSVVHNGVDLDVFSPNGPSDPPAEGYRLLLVEGSLMGGYEQGLEAAEALAYRLSTRLGRSPSHASSRSSWWWWGAPLKACASAGRRRAAFPCIGPVCSRRRASPPSTAPPTCCTPPTSTPLARIL